MVSESATTRRIGKTKIHFTACAGGMVSLTVGMAVTPTDGKLRVFEENWISSNRRRNDLSTCPGSPSWDKEIIQPNLPAMVFAVAPISSVARCDRPADLPQKTCEASSANSTYEGEGAFPAPTEQTEQPKSYSLSLAPATQNSEWHGDNDRGLGLPKGQ